MGVALIGTTPRFPPASIPTLVPQAKPSIQSLGPLTPPLIAPLEIPPTEVIELDVPQSVGSSGGAKDPAPSRIPDPTPYPPYPATNSPTVTATQPVTSQSSNFTISSLPVQDPFSLPPSDRPGRDEVTDMFEVGRFASIVYPKRRWKGFAKYVGTQQPAL